ncbi:MAG: tRNA uridine-5-carboxymethylaminomethyl(34) synthesis GTPase MnmE [Clostridiales bacterium]|nr:tRNA uridine-5-carboxymethylaminomethyl(34) synthesis GTPase MnmE [Clostridiales bacterium]
MNSLNRKNDIITALASPYGKSAVAIIRISGNGCVELLSGFLAKPLKVGMLRVNTFISGSFTENLMAVAYKAPKSYTGEDLVELFPHGNPVICDTIIKALLSGGARLAERGEFTKRAFFNGKLDLMQCEALADIIDAQTAEQLEYGNKRYSGEFKSLSSVQQLLKTALSSIEAVLHYSDEMEQNEVDGAEMSAVLAAVTEAADVLEKEIAGFAGGKVINDGFKVALIGAPNVGKSTLLNALTDSDRAIVTPIAGTTRDTIDGDYVYNGRKFSVTDTAGLNENTDDQVEKIGIERAINAAKDADAVVLVTDGSDINIDKSAFSRFVSVKNKCDSQKDVGIDYNAARDGEWICISAREKINITALKQRLFDLCPADFGSVCNHRQYDCVVRCYDSLNAAKIEAKKAEGLEIVAALLYEAYSAIAELYGDRADESILSEVFERFCVGK